MQNSGQNPHGEADFVMRYEPSSVLDAGCGTGRLAIELDRRGVESVGVDLDEEMLTHARASAPAIRWELVDLTELDLGRTFDVVVTAGNVMIFVEPGTESSVILRLASSVAVGGRVISGFQRRAEQYWVDDYDEHARAVGLELEDRFSSWDRDLFTESSEYVVNVHIRR
jgi:2-polyprenyl-3-methyl-5-hydroxy-6-metoxy-1,4-benzoquinol methylase